MALLTNGYWNSKYWAGNYWMDDYWPECAPEYLLLTLSHGYPLNVALSHDASINVTLSHGYPLNVTLSQEAI